MKKIISPVAALFFFFPGFLYAQKIDSMMNVYANDFPQEKVHVHFDKNLYNPGETIWFKAYLFSGNLPSSLSKNFYTELSDGNGNIIEKKVAPLYEATASGSYDIPKDIKSNHLHFRAYTVWMMNFDTSFMYEKDIRIINKIPIHRKRLVLQKPVSCSFFLREATSLADLKTILPLKQLINMESLYPSKGY